MKFSVVIPTYNRLEKLSLCLDCIVRGSQDLQWTDYEVIITDDGTDDRVREYLMEKYPWANWFKGPKRGPAANRNNGARHAKGDWLVFTDDDCLPNPDWLLEYTRAIESKPACRAFEGAILPDNPNLLDIDMAECPVNDRGGCFWSANIAIEKLLFDSIGGFEERFEIAANEDQDLYQKILKQSPVYFVRTAIVVHPVRFVGIFKKISGLYRSEKSQILLNSIQGFSPLANWMAGIRIHVFAGWSNLKRNHIKRFIYNCVGLLFRIFIAPFLIVSSLFNED